ncbi:MAG: CoA-binding protein [Gammaproteobacteria bacterium]|nr:CoA-binding protein [Gammaproteobacteria bacterium]
MDVVILGASPKPDRFANRAQRRLLAHGHRVIPVNPAFDEVDGVPTVAFEDLAPVPQTITVYLGRDRMLPLVGDIAALAPRRVILNPGADDPEVVAALQTKGVPVQLACTLILLDEGRFDDLAVS